MGTAIAADLVAAGHSVHNTEDSPSRRGSCRADRRSSCDGRLALFVLAADHDLERRLGPLPTACLLGKHESFCPVRTSAMIALI
jgi:hypothetical protein